MTLVRCPKFQNEIYYCSTKLLIEVHDQDIHDQKLFQLIILSDVMPDKVFIKKSNHSTQSRTPAHTHAHF